MLIPCPYCEKNHAWLASKENEAIDVTCSFCSRIFNLAYKVTTEVTKKLPPFTEQNDDGYVPCPYCKKTYFHDTTPRRIDCTCGQEFKINRVTKYRGVPL